MKFESDLPYIREKDFRSIEAVNDFDYIFPDNRRLADVLEDITLVFSSERKQITVSNPTYEKLLY